jgi:DNA-binding MarR family transcriptional regulator
MEEEILLKPYALETELTGYMPIPRQLLDMDLPSTAVLIYGALLDRGTLSRKNHYADESGGVYVIYPVRRLAETFRISDTAVKRHLRALEQKGLIRRLRESRHSPSHIFLSLPAGSAKGTEEATLCPREGPETPPQRGRKVPPNNRKEQHKKSNYYQYGEEESL